MNVEAGVAGPVAAGGHDRQTRTARRRPREFPLTIEVPRGARPVESSRAEPRDGSSRESCLDTGLPEPQQLQVSVQFLVEE